MDSQQYKLCYYYLSIYYDNVDDTVPKMFHHQPANVLPPASIVSHDTHQLTKCYQYLSINQDNVDTVHKMFRHQPANVPPPASIVSYNTHQLTNHYRTIPRPPPGYDTHQLTNQYCMIPKLRAILLSTSHLGQKRPPPMPPTIVRRQRPLRSRSPSTPLTIGPISPVVKLHRGHNDATYLDRE